MQKTILFVLLLITKILVAQPHIQQARCDNNWIIGYGSAVITNTEPCSQITNLPTLTIQPQASSIRFNETCASISDSLGNLLFYTNGIHIANKNYQIMQGSDTLNLGYWSSPNATIDGYRQVQGALILPFPNQTNKYYVFHSRIPNPDELPYAGRKLYYSVVSIHPSTGLSRVVSLRNPIIQNDSLDGRITACRHANGRDWWIMVWRLSTGEYMPLLLDINGIHTTNWQRGAPQSDFTANAAIGQSIFSPNGRKFAINNNYNWQRGNFVSLYDFDRCTGLLSNRQQHHFSDSSGAAGVSFSPNSEILYFNSASRLYSTNLNNINLFSNINTVASYDGFTQFGVATNFYLQHLASDGKIYMCAPNGVQYLHTINDPNNPVIPNFTQHNIMLSTFNAFTVPNFPNFRLGVLSGTICDTLSVATEQSLRNPHIKVFPNPTSDILNIHINTLTTNAVAHIYNTLGQVVFKQNLLYSDNTLSLPTILPNGIYFMSIYTNQKLIGTQKIVLLKD